MKERGFTLIEMLIAIGIFAVLTAFSAANYRAGRRGDELRIASQVAASAIRRAQSAAIGGELVFFCNGVNRTCPDGTAAECGGARCERGVPNGYGVYFSTADPRAIVYFADLNGNRLYDFGEQIRRDPVSAGASVAVSEVSPSAAGSLSAVFLPPGASALLNASSAAPVGRITLRHDATGAIRIVSVNRISGQVGVE